MNNAKIRVLYDENQHPVEVLIEYDEWQKIQAQIGEAEVEPNGQLLNEFAGKIDFGGDPMQIQRAMRAEWPD